ncbi:hypothetical protein C8046_16065 [Serinibacter arcticus]|uniref:D-inositol 3-phosphate glycosyltransferase n=1 Tax=Serinibacter arcticus TaxID=1655435 RepID=A0A2U1ZY65_9MICO|nr:hypothetical protein C8046_16065 [Serinibacter arcticus]
MVHVGVVGDVPGGMAQVVNEYLTWTFPGFEVEAVASTRGRHDPAALVLWLRAAVVLLARRVRCGRSTIAAFHLSERGSFVREGSLVVWARLIGLHVAVHLHGAQFVEFAAARPGLVTRVLERAELVLVLTAATHDVVASLLGSRSGVRVVRISNAVALPPEAGEKEDVVLFGGEIGHRKGVDVLLRAWDAIPANDRAGWRLRLLGPRAMTLAPADLGGDVELLPPVGRRAMALEQSRAAVAVLPSRDEALPMFLVESMAHGCAVVATPVGEVAALLENGAGTLVAVDDADGLARALADLMTQDRRRGEAGRAARARIAARHDAVRVARDLTEHWTHLLEEPA